MVPRKWQEKVLKIKEVLECHAVRGRTKYGDNMERIWRGHRGPVTVEELLPRVRLHVAGLRSTV